MVAIKNIGEVWRGRHHGHGELRVDLEHRRWGLCWNSGWLNVWDRSGGRII